MSSRSFAFSTMVTTAAVVSVCACAWGQASQPITTVPKVAGEASTKPPGKLKLLVWGTAKSEEEARALLADYNKTKIDWEEYLMPPTDYPRIVNDKSLPDLRAGIWSVVVGVCHEEDAMLLRRAFAPLCPTFDVLDVSNGSFAVSCYMPAKQRYMPSVASVQISDKRLTGILFKGMIADDYSLILVLRERGGALLDRKDESGLCDKSRLWWGEDKTLQFTGICVTGLGTTLGTSKVKKVFSIENDKIAVAEESEVLTTPTIHD